MTPDTPSVNAVPTLPEDRLLRYKEVAYILGIPANRVYELSNSGALPSVQVDTTGGSRGRRWRASDVQAYLRALPPYPVGADRRRPPTRMTIMGTRPTRTEGTPVEVEYVDPDDVAS